MKKAIAIGIIGLALCSNRAAAQTAVERAQILRDFHQSVVAYTQQTERLRLFPGAIDAASPAPKIFTLPVAMVFRQLISQALATGERGVVIGAIGAQPRAVLMQPLPGPELVEFPRVLSDALPPLPAPLEYRLAGDDLVIRDANADVVIAILRNAFGSITTHQ